MKNDLIEELNQIRNDVNTLDVNGAWVARNVQALLDLVNSKQIIIAEPDEVVVRIKIDKSVARCVKANGFCDRCAVQKSDCWAEGIQDQLKAALEPPK